MTLGQALRKTQDTLHRPWSVQLFINFDPSHTSFPTGFRFLGHHSVIDRPQLVEVDGKRGEGGGEGLLCADVLACFTDASNLMVQAKEWTPSRCLGSRRRG